MYLFIARDVEVLSNTPASLSGANTASSTPGSVAADRLELLRCPKYSSLPYYILWFFEFSFLHSYLFLQSSSYSL